MKKKISLTDGEKKLVKLILSTATHSNYNELFTQLAVDIGVDEEVVRRYANAQSDLVQPVPEVRTEPAPELSPFQKNIRNIMSGQTSAGRQNITVMSDPASAQIEEHMKNQPVKGANRFNKNVFRGNK